MRTASVIADRYRQYRGAITDHTSGALDGYEPEDVKGLLSDRLETAKADLGTALETVDALCEGVGHPATPRRTLRPRSAHAWTRVSQNPGPI